MLKELFLSLKISVRFNHQLLRNCNMLSTYLISVFFISLSIIASILSLSIINGFEYELNERILPIVPSYEIEPINLSNEWQKTVKLIELMPGIVTAVPYINFTALIIYNEKLQLFQIKGIDFLKEKKISKLFNFIENNVWQNFKLRKQQILLGKTIANRMNIQPGDWINIIIFDTKTKTLLQSSNIRLQVNDILTTNSQIDNHLAIIPLEDAKSYLNQRDILGGIAIKVNSLFNTNSFLKNIKKIVKNNIYIYDCANKYKYIYHDIQMVRTIIYLAMIIILILSCFNIIANILMLIKNKSVDIAILITLGADNKLINFIFIWYGLLIGIISNIIGTTIGLIISINLTTIIKYIENILNIKIFFSDAYFINFVPTKILGENIISVIMITLLLVTIFSWYSVKYASRINLIKLIDAKYK